MADDKIVNIKEKIEPVRPSEFSLLQHKSNQHSCVLPAGIGKDDLENPALWQNVSNKIQITDEIRMIAEDMSFVAYGIVTACYANDVRVRITHGCDLEDIEIDMPEDRYSIKLRGMKKWTIIDNRDGSIIKENIATQKLALNERDDYVKALAI